MSEPRPDNRRECTQQRSYRARGSVIYDKLGVGERAAAVATALRTGLVA